MQAQCKLLLLPANDVKYIAIKRASERASRGSRRTDRKAPLYVSGYLFLLLDDYNT